MAAPDILNQARQGDTNALSRLINQALQPKAISAKVTRSGTCLRVLLESEQVPNQQAMVQYLKASLTKLQITDIQTVVIYGKQNCAAAPAWNQKFALEMFDAERSQLASTQSPVKETAVSTPVLKPQRTSSKAKVSTNRNKQTPQILALVAFSSILLLLGATLSSGIRSLGRRQTYVENTKTQDGSYHAPIIRRDGGTPVIEVTFNGSQTFPMIVDTGASGTLITQAMANVLGVRTIRQVEALTPSGRTVFDVGYVRSIEVGDAEIRDIPVAITGNMTVGLLGHDFLDYFDVMIREKEVVFHPRQ